MDVVVGVVVVVDVYHPYKPFHNDQGQYIRLLNYNEMERKHSNNLVGNWYNL